MTPGASRRLAWAGTALTLLLGWALPAAGQPAGYYDGVDATNAAALRSTLHEVIDDHTKVPYTSSTTSDVWDCVNAAEQNPGNSSQIVDIYRNAAYAKIAGGTGAYNREHVWPKSYGFPNDGPANFPHTDCHHLFASDTNYNNNRGNKPFADCPGCSEVVTLANDGRGGGSGVYPGNSNWTTGTGYTGRWQTWGGRKGDVARAIFYMAIRYEGDTHGVTGAFEPDLELTDDIQQIEAYRTNNNENVAYMGLLTTLLQWHAADPVDARERSRNDVVQGFQGNRNPFIDHPEWVACIFQGQCSGGGGNTPPSASFTFTTSGLTASFTDTSTDSGGSVTAWSWSFGDGTTSATRHPTKTWASAGTWTVSLTVTDNLGATHSASRSVTVTSGPQALANGVPVTNLSGTTGTGRFFTLAVPAGATNLRFATSGGSGDADLYVRFGAAPTATIYDCRSESGTNTESCPIATAQAGTYHVLVHAYATYSGLSLTGSYTTGPANVAPSAGFNFTTSGLTATFTDTSTDSDGTIASWSWSFGDGTTSTARHPVKTYATAGTRTVTLTVTDNGGRTGTTSRSVTVTAGCTSYSGTLASGASAYQPAASPGYYTSTVSGAHTGALDGPSATDFDLYLQKWNGSSWANVASGTSANPDENTTYSGTAGNYRYRVHAYSGSGSYTLCITKP
jgi:PKD repeat protein